ncbi:MAG: crossover junction endodeoxyribonuclease RuvC [Candidatus Celaenobacter antarcticus]|nr:crossover junction endodeoxyribonuclease RuvC [Candidatus Celaenobacter antarcticus]MDP8315414.1 crossover junction endodeoxyribonuclease RuvC [Candidatus Celaenobacter antarcticus]
MSKQEIIVGIDPGSKATGYAFLYVEHKKVKPLSFGVIKTNPKMTLAKRITLLYEELNKLIAEFKPTIASIEKIFYAKNVRSLVSLGEARGVLLLALEQAQIPIYEYSAREVKKAVVGNGNASKQQVQYMVKNIIKIKDEKLQFDITDALAIALCHVNKLQYV